MVKANEIRDIFEKEMESFEGTKDLRTLCEITMTFTLFEILDEIQKLK